MVTSTPTTGATEFPKADIEASELPVEGMPIYGDKENLFERYGFKKGLGETQAHLHSSERREPLLETLQREHPEVNGNASKALESLKLNTEQLKKKESFLKKIAKFPLRHPFITSAGALALSAFISPVGTNIISKLETAAANVPFDKILTSIKKFTGLSGAASSVAEPGVLGPPPYAA